MMDDCVKYQKGCEVCQRFGNIQLAPAGVINSIVKPWPFREWGLDLIGEIHPFDLLDDELGVTFHKQLPDLHR
jgi:hypothetical protein